MASVDFVSTVQLSYMYLYGSPKNVQDTVKESIIQPRILLILVYKALMEFSYRLIDVLNDLLTEKI